MTNIEIGVFGGSGLYNMDELTNIEERKLTTPFGDPSDVITIGTLHGRRVAFLPRHGRGHVLNPTEVPYQANVYAMKMLGVKYLISVNACGSLQQQYAPGHVVVPDQLYDHTRHQRSRSFFNGGLVSHVTVADPFSAELSQAIVDATRAAGGTVHAGGNFITIEGPRFSTKVESRTFRLWGMDIIGMTTCPEAFLAAEAEIAYASMAMVTDYDCWHESEEPVTVEMVIETLGQNARLAQNSLSHMVAHFDDWAGDYPVHDALKFALITDHSKVTPEIRAKFGILVDKYFD
ncbi:MAG: 5'-methylthioadenosine phosphorylase [Cellvibrionaceae bacterium]|jgi:5'-methylthioadenosine phosphorylase